MTVEEFYLSAGGDYNEVIERFKTDEKVLKYLKMLLNDTTYDTLVSSMEAKDYKLAFRMAHTLKGMAVNLSLTKLYDLSSALTEKLRADDLVDIESYYQPVNECYSHIQELIIGLLG